jgi:hypothetical protein
MPLCCRRWEIHAVKLHGVVLENGLDDVVLHRHAGFRSDGQNTGFDIRYGGVIVGAIETARVVDQTTWPEVGCVRTTSSSARMGVFKAAFAVAPAE